MPNETKISVERVSNLRTNLVKIRMRVGRKSDKLPPNKFAHVLNVCCMVLKVSNDRFKKKFNINDNVFYRWSSGTRAPYAGTQQDILTYFINRAEYLLSRTAQVDYSADFFCETCGGVISEEQILQAENRGRVPKYCSTTCWGKRPREHNYDDTFLNTDSEFAAYFMGFWTADGHFSKADNGISITSTDKQIVDVFTTVTKFTNNVRVRRQEGYKDQYTVIWYGEVTNRVLEMGYTPGAKTGTEFVPKRFRKEPWVHHFIRGFFDGDGSIVLNKNGSLSSYLVNASRNLLRGIHNYLYKKKIVRGGALHNPKPNFYKLQFGHYDTVQFCKFMYKDATYLLGRKHKIYLSGKDFVQGCVPQTNTVCYYQDCTNKARSKGLCKKHYDIEYDAYYRKNKEDKTKKRARDKKYKDENRDKINAQRRARYADDPEKHRAAVRKYRENNPDKVKAYKQKYQEENREKVREQKREYRRKNRDKVLAQERDWFERNKEKKLKYNREWKRKKRAELKKKQEAKVDPA